MLTCRWSIDNAGQWKISKAGLYQYRMKMPNIASTSASHCQVWLRVSQYITQILHHLWATGSSKSQRVQGGCESRQEDWANSKRIGPGVHTVLTLIDYQNGRSGKICFGLTIRGFMSTGFPNQKKNIFTAQTSQMSQPQDNQQSKRCLNEM